MTYYRKHYRRPVHTGSNAVSTSLPLRFAAALLLLAVVLLLRHQSPELLESLRNQLTANTGEIAQAFARFTDNLSDGEPVAEAWAVLTGELSSLQESQVPNTKQP